MSFEEYCKRFRKRLEKLDVQVTVTEEELSKMFISLLVFSEFQVEEAKKEMTKSKGW